MNLLKKLFNKFASSNKSAATANSAQKNLAKLKQVAVLKYRDPAAFGRSMKDMGYKCVQQTQWGSLVFEKDDCRVVLSATTSSIHNLQFRSESEDKTHELVIEGVLVQ